MYCKPSTKVINSNKEQGVIEVKGSLNFSITNQTNVAVIIDHFKTLAPNASVGYEFIAGHLYFADVKYQFDLTDVGGDLSQVTGYLILSETVPSENQTT